MEGRLVSNGLGRLIQRQNEHSVNLAMPLRRGDINPETSWIYKKTLRRGLVRHSRRFGVAGLSTAPFPQRDGPQRAYCKAFCYKYLWIILRRSVKYHSTWHAPCCTRVMQSRCHLQTVRQALLKLPFFPRCEGLSPPTTRGALQAPFEAVLARDGFFMRSGRRVHCHDRIPVVILPE